MLTVCQEVSCVSIYSLSTYFPTAVCWALGCLLCEHLLCAKASVVVITYCVSGIGLLCEHLLSEHLHVIIYCLPGSVGFCY